MKAMTVQDDIECRAILSVVDQREFIVNLPSNFNNASSLDYLEH